ncbi:MAG: hypothetical protein ABIA59_02925, partial [Candidatus Latescibacterota bacterium]
FRNLPIRVAFLHNVVVDLILSLEIEGLLKFYADYIRDKHGMRPGFGSLNLPLLIERLDAEDVKDAAIMTSVNKTGFFMNPSPAACEKVLADGSRDIVAMSILASGAIPAPEAFQYAASFPAVKSLLFGSSRRETLEKSLAIIRELDG